MPLASMQIRGAQESLTAVDGLIAATDPKAVFRNFRSLVRFTLREIQQRTPGKGDLRGDWEAKFTVRRFKSGTRLRARIENKRANRVVYYNSAYDGKRRRKLKADGKSMKWWEVIRILDRGSKPHVIKPRRAKSLIFMAKNIAAVPDAGGQLRVGGRFASANVLVFAKSVKHPGTRAYGLLSEPTRMVNKAVASTADNMEENIITTWESRTGKGPRLRAVNARAFRS